MTTYLAMALAWPQSAVLYLGLICEAVLCWQWATNRRGA